MSETEVQFSLQRKAIGDKWIAVAFSDDPGMVGFGLSCE